MKIPIAARFYAILLCNCFLPASVFAQSLANHEELFRIYQISGIQGYSYPFSYSSLQINNSGQVVGTQNSTAQLWNAGATTSLGVAPGGHYSRGIAINNQGTALGNIDDSFGNALTGSKTTNGVWQFSRWPTGGYQYIWSSAINDLNQFVGYASYTPGSPGRAFYHSGANGNTLPTILSNPTGFTFSTALGINNNGIIVGNAFSSVDSPIAVAWSTNGGRQVLGSVGTSSSAQAINDYNIAVGFSGKDAVAWDAAGMHNIYSGQNGSTAVANSINNLNVIVGNSVQSNTYADSKAFLYYEGQSADLNLLHGSTSILYTADDINDRMQIVGQSSAGAFIANPIQNRTSSGNWNDSNGWRWGLTPNETSTVALSASSANPLILTGPSAKATIAELRVGSTTSGTVLFVIQNSQNLNVQASFWGNGSTQVANSGILSVDGTLTTSLLRVDGALLGSGQINAPVEMAGFYSPGNSAGLQQLSDLRFVDGSLFNWELYANTDAGRGVYFDGVDVTGTLSMGSMSSSYLSFDGSGSTVDFSNAFWQSNHSWLVFDSGNILGQFSPLFSISADSNGYTGLSADAFSWRTSGSELWLDYSVAAVPEPSAFALLAVTGLPFLYRKIRNRNI